MQVPPTPGSGSAPVFLNNLDCSSSDTDILSCHTLFSSVGLSNCTHAQDVSVRCLGKLPMCTSFVDSYCQLCTFRY